MMSDGQCEIFYCITSKHIKYGWISAPSRYGKSETAAIALIYLARFFDLKIIIIGATDEKANKIMEYVVEHIGDHEDLSIGLLNTDIKQIDKLKIQTSKKALRWASGGWIYITSIDAKSVAAGGEKAVGEGADVVYIEESPLIKTKEQMSKIIRMPEIDRGWGKLLQAGNLFEGNHFEEAFNSNRYYKAFVPLDQAMYEKGWSEDFIKDKVDQMTTKDAKRMYYMVFPQRGEMTFFDPKTYGILPEITAYYGAMDPALGKVTSKSNTAIVVVGVDENGYIYEIESHIGKIKPDDAMDIILNLPYTFTRFGIESIQFQDYFREQLIAKSNNAKKYIPFEAIQQQRAKEMRVESLEPQIKSGLIRFRGNNELYNEAVDYPDSSTIDGLDTLEMCFRLVSDNDWAPVG